MRACCASSLEPVVECPCECSTDKDLRHSSASSRSHALTAAQLRRLLGFQTRMQVDAFLKEHEAYDFTAADFEQDRETLRQLRVREAQP